MMMVYVVSLLSLSSHSYLSNFETGFSDFSGSWNLDPIILWVCTWFLSYHSLREWWTLRVHLF